MNQEALPHTIGRYQVLSLLGKGGMGEVFLVYDPLCQRQIALKRIRPEMQNKPILKDRFLREARIAGSLSHPGVISVFEVDLNPHAPYYTMAYVEGKTLKTLQRELFSAAQQKENSQEGSIPSLMPIYLQICQTIAYIHSRQIIHRDIKPENIIVGKYGEVVLLDWGVAKKISEVHEEALDGEMPTRSKTRASAPIGTIAYMAPERISGTPANISTDIYSLGILLYCLLTLKLPFHRPSLEAFRKNHHKERLLDPAQVAPFREVPRLLSSITAKCLAVNPAERYQSVDELIFDLKIYLEGRSDWFLVDQLDISKPDNWEFHENILLAGPLAITGSPDALDWVSLMVSRNSFSGNLKLTAKIRVQPQNDGIGFMLGVPEPAERVHISDGYLLWLTAHSNQETKLLLSGVEVLRAPKTRLTPNQWHEIRLEKVDLNISLYIDNVLQFTYVGYLPWEGTHIGVLYRDTEFDLEALKLWSGNLSLQINCLGIPDAFLANKDYTKALAEYRRIAYSFPELREGREALFRSGITLLQQAQTLSGADQENLLHQALEAFEQLRSTPGAPLEYLGKALVYQVLKEPEEEIKCLELGLRRYHAHPLVKIIEKHLLARMHESSRVDRHTAYRLMLIALQLLPQEIMHPHHAQLFIDLEKNWEPLEFIEPSGSNKLFDKNHQTQLKISLAFWLGRSTSLQEIVQELRQEAPQDNVNIDNALFCQQVLTFSDIGLPHLPLRLPETFAQQRQYGLQLKYALMHDHAETLQALLSLPSSPIWDPYKVTAQLSMHQWKAAEELLKAHQSECHQDASPFFMFYGCWLAGTRGPEAALAHFNTLLDTPFPRSTTLLGQHLLGRLQSKWHQQAFFWEKRQLYRSLILYFRCLSDSVEEEKWRILYNALFQESGRKQPLA